MNCFEQVQALEMSQLHVGNEGDESNKSQSKIRNKNGPNRNVLDNEYTSMSGQSPQRLVENDTGMDSSQSSLANSPIINDDFEEEELKYGAKHVIKLFIPVSLCMLVVVATMNSISFYTSTNVYLVYTPYTDQNVDTPTKVWQSFANALILMCVIVVMTFVLLGLYKIQCYKVSHGWLIIS